MELRKPKVLVYQATKETDLLKIFLESAGFCVDILSSFSIEAVKEQLKLGDFDICILDSADTLGGDKLEFLEYLRLFDTATPCVFVSDLDNADYVPCVLDKGADDCMHRPFNYNELVSRLKAVLRRTGLKKKSVEPVYEIGMFKFDTAGRTLSTRIKGADGETADYIEKLPVKESRLLELLCMNAGRLVTKKEITKYIWNAEAGYLSQMNVYVHKLRQFLMQDANVSVRNVHGTGYILEC